MDATGGFEMAGRPGNYTFSLSRRAGDLVDRIPNAGRNTMGKSASVSRAIEWYFTAPVYEKEYTTGPPELRSSYDIDDWKATAVETGKLVPSEYGSIRHPTHLITHLATVLKQKSELEARLASRPPIVREHRSLLARILSRMRAWLPGR